MGLVYQERPDRGVTYVYSSESYYDPEKKQSRSKRKLIGKLDPESGEIVPTGKSGRKKGSGKQAASKKKAATKQTAAAAEKGDDPMEGLGRELEARDREIDMLKNRISILEKDNEKLRAESGRTRALLEEQRAQLAGVVDQASLMTGKMKEILSMK